MAGTHDGAGEVHLDDRISQAEAARRRGVTPQAIARLVKRGRLRTLTVGGHTLVHQEDVASFAPHQPGRRKEARDT